MSSKQTKRPPRRGLSRLEWLVIVATLVILAAILLPVFAGAYESNCRSSMECILEGLQQYASDNDGCLPDAGTWRTDIWPHIEQYDASPSYPILWCEVSRLEDDSYTLNPNLAGKRLDEIAAPETTVLLYETGLADGRGPHRRHRGHVCYVDGRIELIAPEGFRLQRADAP